jgi:hypothetical protein
MSTDEVQALRRDFNDLRDEVHSWGEKIGLIHETVLRMAKKTYVPAAARKATLRQTKSRS